MNPRDMDWKPSLVYAWYQVADNLDDHFIYRYRKDREYYPIDPGHLIPMDIFNREKYRIEHLGVDGKTWFETALYDECNLDHLVANVVDAGAGKYRYYLKED
jgi:hypothetical protein